MEGSPICTGLELALIGGTALSVVGQAQQAKVQTQALERQAQLDRTAGIAEEERLRKEAETLKGRQRVAIAKSGIAESGSALEVMRRSAEEAELEALNIRFGAEAGAQSRLFEAQQVQKAQPFKTGATLLTGLGGLR